MTALPAKLVVNGMNVPLFLLGVFLTWFIVAFVCQTGPFVWIGAYLNARAARKTLRLVGRVAVESERVQRDADEWGCT